jgi:hypothetical protein
MLPLAVSTAADEQDALKKVYGPVADEPWKAGQEKGEVSVGVVVYEKEGKLYLDGKPCEKKFYYFSNPYEKTPTGRTVKCRDESFTEYRVRQK